MSAIKTGKIHTSQYLPIFLDSLRSDSILDFDLYLKREGNYLLYRSSQMPFDEKNRIALLDKCMRKLYISTDNQHLYQKYIESNIDQIINDNSIDVNTKASIVYDATKSLMRDVLTNPTLNDNIKRSQAMVESTVFFILNERHAFSNMLKMMSFDYYTYTHSVNVCIFSVALAQHIGVDNSMELNQLGIGALLHDVGKTRISESILNKNGALTPEEMEIIRKHPEWGYEIIRETDIIPEESYIPIIQHHERENKSGYPKGIGTNEIHQFGKIVAIADVFDAMTTEHVYRSAITSFETLREMHDEKGAFNKNLLGHFTNLLGPSGLLFY